MLLLFGRTSTSTAVRIERDSIVSSVLSVSKLSPPVTILLGLPSDRRAYCYHVAGITDKRTVHTP